MEKKIDKKFESLELKLLESVEELMINEKGMLEKELPERNKYGSKGIFLEGHNEGCYLFSEEEYYFIPKSKKYVKRKNSSPASISPSYKEISKLNVIKETNIISIYRKLKEKTILGIHRPGNLGVSCHVYYTKPVKKER